MDIANVPFKIEPFSIYEEVYAEWEHYKGPAPEISVDIGAHHGALTWILASQGSTVFAAEPIHFAQLAENIDKCGLRRLVIPLPFAISRSSSFSMSMRLAREPSMASMILNDAETIGKKAVPLMSFKDLLRIVGPRIDYLKIDCEGGEYSFMIPGKDLSRMLEGVAYLHIELHGCEVFHYYYTDQYLPKKYQKAERPDELLVRWLYQDFDLREIVSQPQKRVFVGPRR